MTNSRPAEPATDRKTKVQEVLENLAASATDPVHKRLIETYRGDEPYDAVVAEFSKILDKVARGEA